MRRDEESKLHHQDRLRFSNWILAQAGERDFICSKYWRRVGRSRTISFFYQTNHIHESNSLKSVTSVYVNLHVCMYILILFFFYRNLLFVISCPFLSGENDDGRDSWQELMSLPSPSVLKACSSMTAYNLISLKIL